MPSLRVSRDLKDEIYFVTLTVSNWYYFFDKFNRFKILEESFVYCQKNKGLKIYAFVFMLNHLHFIGSAPDLGAVLRDMKKFLSKEFKKNIELNEPSKIKKFIKNGKFIFWMPTNCPKIIETEYFFSQKMDYIHNNPVAKGYVESPDEWMWSSASIVPTKINIEEDDEF